ncbi:hypothetical protein EMEDMD4_210038 [Sinorhizobium medicae]|uniref:Uncharacterized protein n=1 Tax=Sinorhizobium medicae TaxID=110321 RepID=A0A508WTJ4_9HYPH|nr:hypothetical protein EMEDMD4_210038 [Sinorhizobium medicae]
MRNSGPRGKLSDTQVSSPAQFTKFASDFRHMSVPHLIGSSEYRIPGTRFLPDTLASWSKW